MSPTSIGFVLLLGVLHVCSGKTAGPLQSLSVSWKELIWLKKNQSKPLQPFAKCMHVENASLLGKKVAAGQLKVLKTTPKAPFRSV